MCVTAYNECQGDGSLVSRKRLHGVLSDRSSVGVKDVRERVC